jgi:hypothetical protein
MDLIQEQLGSQIVEVHSTLHQFMNKFQGPSSSDPPLYTEGVDSNQPLHSHSNSLPHDPHLPRVEVNKFDGSDPQAWVTQMEHYFSLHGITDELTKLHYGILYLDLNDGNGGNGIEMHAKGMLLGHSLLQSCMNALTQTPTI